MKKITIVGIFALTLLMFGACTKSKDGAPGAQGPQGNANVSASTQTTTDSSWTLINSNNWLATFNVPEITSSVFSGGTIQVFIGDGTVWTAMPYSYGIEQYNYSHELGLITISMTNSDGSAPSNPGVVQFKFVVIPPAAMLLHPNVNLQNYNELKATYKL